VTKEQSDKLRSEVAELQETAKAFKEAADRLLRRSEELKKKIEKAAAKKPAEG
jgi:uncharacterized coiled-coil DUF342 family protein